MLKYLEMTGKTEEEAVEKALAQLGLDRDDVSVELLERAKSGFLGLGSSPARIRVQYEAPDETPAAAPAEAQPAVTAEAEAPRAAQAMAVAARLRLHEPPAHEPTPRAPHASSWCGRRCHRARGSNSRGSLPMRCRRESHLTCGCSMLGAALWPWGRRSRSSPRARSS